MKFIKSIVRACLPVLLGIFLLLTALSSGAGAQTLIPHFDCAEPVYTNGVLTQLKAYFGYENKTNAVITYGDGANNFFSPNPSGIYTNMQITTFQPGYYEKSFFITVNYPQIVNWVLNNISSTTTNNPANFCGTGMMNYQGRLSTGGTPPTGQYDLQFKFYESLTGGTAHPKVIVADNVPVTSGLFSTQLDVSSIFISNAKIGFLEIGLRPAGDSHPFTVLSPRQPIAAAPYAVNAKSVSGGMVQIPVSTIIDTNSCNEPTEVGQIMLITSGPSFYVCTAAGWKSVTLQ